VKLPSAAGADPIITGGAPRPVVLLHTMLSPLAVFETVICVTYRSTTGIDRIVSIHIYDGAGITE
jgi:hypothetical protein